MILKIVLRISGLAVAGCVGYFLASSIEYSNDTIIDLIMLGFGILAGLICMMNDPESRFMFLLCTGSLLGGAYATYVLHIQNVMYYFGAFGALIGVTIRTSLGNTKKSEAVIT